MSEHDEEMPENDMAPLNPSALGETLGKKFDAMLERMQTPEARKAMRRAFNATPKQLGKAALAAAQKEKLDKNAG